MKRLQMTLTKAFDAFIFDQRLRGNTEKTIEGYQGFLTRFIDWQTTTNGVSDLAELSLSHVQQYQIYLDTKPAERNGGEKLTKRSIQTYMRHIKVFLTFCFEEGFHSEPLHQKLKLPKAERPIIEILTDDEIAVILKTFSGTENEKRNRALILILLDCGLRLSELVGIKICDINFSKGYIMVNGKGRKGRIVPIGERVTQDMHEYIRFRGDAETNYLFQTNNLTPMTSACVHSLMRKLKKRTGIKRIHAHLFRHTFATNFLVHGLGDVYELSRILGHSEIRVTEKYLQLASTAFLVLFIQKTSLKIFIRIL